jgi:hypothetical protein
MVNDSYKSDKLKRDLNNTFAGIQQSRESGIKQRNENRKLALEEKKADMQALNFLAKENPEAALSFASQIGIVPEQGMANAAAESDMTTYNQITQLMKDIADDERQIALGDNYGSKPSGASGTALGNLWPFGQTTKRADRVTENRANIQKLLPQLKDAAFIKQLQDQGVTLAAPQSNSALSTLMGGANNVPVSQAPAAAPQPTPTTSAWDRRSSLGGARYLGY